MGTDEPRPIQSESDDVFEIGERTIFRMKSQESPFDADELGTLIVRPHRTVERAGDIPAPVLPVADPLVRIEQKLDALARTLEAVQRRLDALDRQTPEERA